jgi:hypothetical protein
MNHNLELVANLECFGLDREAELAERKRAFRFASDVDEQLFLVLGDNDTGEDLALVEYL